MSEAADRYARNAARFVDLVKAVDDDQWDAPTPCEEWTVRQLVRHVVDTHHMFLRLVGIDPVDHPSVDDDPVQAILAVTTQLAEAMSEPAVATRTYEGIFGTRTLEWGVDNFQTDDLVIHGWDLATAIGADATIPAAEIETVRTHTEGWGDNVRAPGVMGPALDPPAGADDQTKLLAFLGRRAW